MISQKELVDYLKSIKVGDLQDLISTLEDELGVQASAPQFIPQNVQVEQSVVEQSEFDLVLTGFTGKKINIIKAIRAMTGAGLKDSKEMVEATPTVLREGISKEVAERLAKDLRDANGEVEIR